MRRPLHLPPEAHNLLQPHFPALDLSSIHFMEGIPRFLRLTSPIHPAAIACYNTVYFAPGHFDPHTPRGLALVAHELEHVVQWRRHGRAAFLTQYLFHYFAARTRRLAPVDAYLAIDFERQAREKEAKVLRALS